MPSDDLARWYQACNPDGEAASDWYVPFDAWLDPATRQLVALRGTSVAESIQRAIDLSSTVPGSAHLLAGFRGAGKTTELRRLRNALVQGGGYAVLQMSADHYHHMADALSAEEMGLVIAAGIGEAAGGQPIGLKAFGNQGIWNRVHAFLSKEPELKEWALKIGPIEIKGALKAGGGYRDRLRKVYGERPGALREFVHGVVHEVAALFSPARLVVLIDGLEKYYVDVEHLERVYREMAERFAHEPELLNLPSCHVVYVVPPYLAFLNQTVGSRYGGRPFVLASVKVHDRPPDRAPFEPGLRALEQVLANRVDLDRLFGANRRACVTQMAAASGGHVRDLLDLAREVILGIREPPAGPDDVERAIAALSSSRGFVFREGVELLRRVEKEGRLDDASETEIGSLARAFDQQLLLCYQNGEPWYDAHPLARRALPPGPEAGARRKARQTRRARR